MKISLSNSKLGNQIPTLNLPAITTCRENTPCKKGCYACKGTWLYPNVKASLLDNLVSYRVNASKFFNDIIDYLNNDDVIYKFFRWFSSSDIVDEAFLKGMIKVAKACTQTKFLCFTKKFEIINDYLSNGEILPNNLKVVFSAWDKSFKVDNPYDLPTTYVNFKDTERNVDIPTLATPCVGNCQKCKVCWSLNKGQSVYFNQH